MLNVLYRYPLYYSKLSDDILFVFYDLKYDDSFNIVFYSLIYYILMANKSS